MPLEESVRKLREQRVQYESSPVPLTLQGIGKDRIRSVLGRIDRATDEMVDTVYALLDNETDSWFSRVPDGTEFSHGSTTAHIGCHVGILQRGANKLDREGRDYWIKEENIRKSVEPQARMAERSRRMVAATHRDLINFCRTAYVPNPSPAIGSSFPMKPTENR